jgi:hypothetical protein
MAKISKKTRANLLRYYHASAVVVWAVMLPISLMTGLKTSLPFIVGISVWALVCSEFGAWQGSRAEAAAVESGQHE